MMVLFQDKIIYMPSLPPFSRSEKIESYARACAPVLWKEESIKSTDGTRISLCIGSLSNCHINGSEAKATRHIVILYFQGNGSSLPPRLPALSNVMKAVCACGEPTTISLVGLSYRGYWTSSGRATQRGIEKDAAAALAWTLKFRANLAKDAKLVLWGQSIGAGVATQTVANALKEGMIESPNSKIDGMVLETPFTSVRSMLLSLYPQVWLPYRYLVPFLWNHWDSERALQDIHTLGGPERLLIVDAGMDEVVPLEQGVRLKELVERLGFIATHVLVRGSLHHETIFKQHGKAAVVLFLSGIARADKFKR